MGFLLAVLSLSARADLLVLNTGTGGDFSANGYPCMLRFDADTGARIGGFGSTSEAYYNLVLTSAGEICVTSNILGYYDVQRFTPAGQFDGNVASAWQAAFAGLLRGPGGHLYSIMWDDAANVSRIVRHDGPIPSVLVESGAGGMTKPINMILGADGNLYVSDFASGILRFNATTGAFGGVFVPAGSGGMARADRMVFGPDGNLYASARDANIYRFSGASGAFIDLFISDVPAQLTAAGGIAFGPDGNFYVVCRSAKRVRRFHGTTGAYLNDAAVDQDLKSPGDIAFTPPAPPATVRFGNGLPAGAVATEVAKR